MNHETSNNWINVLRIGGVLALVLGSFLFLVDGVSAADPLMRSFKFFGITVVLTCSGLSVAWYLREMRGARMLLGLALLSIPINVTQIGSLLWSMLHETQANGTLFLQSQGAASVISTSVLIALLLVKLLVLSSLCFVACYCLYRKSGTTLSTAILSLSALLLFPIREGFSFILLGVVFAALSGHQVLRIRRLLPDLPTFESRVWRVVLALPLAIYLGRSMMLHDAEVYALGLGFLTLGILPAMLFPAKSPAKGVNSKYLIAVYALNFLGVALICAGFLANVAWSHMLKSLTVSLVSVLASYITAMLFKKYREQVLFVGFIIASLWLTSVYFVSGLNYVQCFVALGYAGIAFYAAIKARGHIRATLAFATIVCALLPLIIHAVSSLSFTWWTLCVAGGLAVIVASFCEKAELQKSTVWLVLRGM